MELQRVSKASKRLLGAPRRSSKSLYSKQLVEPVPVPERIDVERHDADEVFKALPAEDFFWSHVVIVDGEVSRSEGRQGYEGHATSMTRPGARRA